MNEDLLDPADAPDQRAVILVEYICERCGFHYHKAFDFQPYLCYRCMRFIAKRVFVTMNTITPLARTDQGDI